MEAKESGKQSAGRLLQTQGANTAHSQYRSAKNTASLTIPTLTHPITVACMATAVTPMPELRNWNAQLTRNTVTTASHFGDLCHAKSQPVKQQPTPPNTTTAEAESAVFDALCTVNNSCQHQSASAITLDHHL